MNNKEKTVIYVFGPKRLSEDYKAGKVLTIENGGWLKIGLTTCNMADDAADAAMKRIQGEVRTGIAETCRLFEVFEYPLMPGKPDDEIRGILTSGMYNLDNSKDNNKKIEDIYEIKAGNEYVYGISKNNLRYAIIAFERELFKKYFNKEAEDRQLFSDCIERNDSRYEMPVSDDDSSSTKTYTTNDKYDKFWEKVISKLPNNIKEIVHLSKGRPYINIGNSNGRFMVNAVFSPQKDEAMVDLNGPKVGEEGKQEIERFIKDNGIANINALQGTRCLERWYWPETTQYSQDEENLVNWFAEKIQIFYDNFKPVLEL